MEKTFFAIGALGFFALFQAVGSAVFAATVGAYKDARRKGERRAQGGEGLAVGVFVGAFFNGIPLVMAHGFGGWPMFTAQVAVLVGIAAMALWPHRAAGDQTVAAATTEEAAARGPWWRSLPGAVTCFGLSGGYAAWHRGTVVFGLDGHWLRTLVEVEALVIHSVPFLSLIALPRPRYRRWRAFQWFLFVTWYCLYLGFASDKSGTDGVTAFLVGTLGTYLGFLLQDLRNRRVAGAFERWVTSFTVFVACAAAFDLGDMRNPDAVMATGLWYFAALGVAEVSPLYRRPWLQRWREWSERRSRR